MSIFARLFSAGTKAAYTPTSGLNLTTAFARDRLARTMPGETAARTGSSYGLFI